MATMGDEGEYVVQIKNDDFTLLLAPYAKGIMIHGINVNPKLRNTDFIKYTYHFYF